MEIKDFIATTISEIILAIEEAGTPDHLVNIAMGKPVVFDLAVTASAEEGSRKEQQGAGSIRIAQAHLSSRTGTSSREQAIQRVKFEIDISESPNRLAKRFPEDTAVEVDYFGN